MGERLSTWIVALLSAGGATFILATAKAWQVMRGGARGRERDAWDDLLDHNKWLDRRATLAEQDRDYLRSLLAHARWQLVTNGIEPDPRNVVLPSERATRAEIEKHGGRRRPESPLRAPESGWTNGGHDDTEPT